MFKKKRKKTVEEELSSTAYKTLHDALKAILTTEIKKTGADGKEITDSALTVSAIRMKARIALDFVDSLKNTAVEEK